LSGESRGVSAFFVRKLAAVFGGEIKSGFIANEANLPEKRSGMRWDM
jgi:hypothetical protein